MTRAVVLAAVLCLLPRYADADGRINFRIDFTHADIDGVYSDVGIGWQGLEVEIEKAFATHKIVLSGFSLGVRRELFYGFTGFGETKNVQRWDEGTYLTLRVFRSFDVSTDKSWSIGPSLAILYGIPGTTLDRTIAARQEDGGLDYTHVFPMRNADVPKQLAETADVGTSSRFSIRKCPCRSRSGSPEAGSISSGSAACGSSGSGSSTRAVREIASRSGGRSCHPSACAWDSGFSERRSNPRSRLSCRPALSVTTRRGASS